MLCQCQAHELGCSGSENRSALCDARSDADDDDDDECLGLGGERVQHILIVYICVLEVVLRRRMHTPLCVRKKRKMDLGMRHESWRNAHEECSKCNSFLVCVRDEVQMLVREQQKYQLLTFP